jgi:hypothetical protein
LFRRQPAENSNDDRKRSWRGYIDSCRLKFRRAAGAGVGGMFDLAGIALLVMFLGLIEGEGAKSEE